MNRTIYNKISEDHDDPNTENSDEVKILDLPEESTINMPPENTETSTVVLRY